MTSRGDYDPCKKKDDWDIDKVCIEKICVEKIIICNVDIQVKICKKCKKDKHDDCKYDDGCCDKKKDYDYDEKRMNYKNAYHESFNNIINDL